MLVFAVILAFVRPAYSLVGDDSAVAYEASVMMKRCFAQEFIESELAGIIYSLSPSWSTLRKQHGSYQSQELDSLLQSYFLQLRGWQLQGRPTQSLFKNLIPNHIVDSLDWMINPKNITLERLACFAFNVERVIHQRASSSLRRVYDVLGYKQDRFLNDGEATEVLENVALEIISGKTLIKPGEPVTSGYHSWKDTQVWLADLRKTMQSERQATNLSVDDGLLGMSEMNTIVLNFSEGFGLFQDMDCLRMKDELLEGDVNGTGRVLFTDFHKLSQSFSETQEELRRSGSLEDGPDGTSRVIIPNYLLSNSNCLVGNPFYKSCCRNECDAIRTKLFRAIGSPETSVRRFLTAVSSFKPLSEEMTQRLHEIAVRHAGKVVLDAYDVAEWLHAVFPNECPKPSSKDDVAFDPHGYIDRRDKLFSNLSEQVARTVYSTPLNALYLNRVSMFNIIERVREDFLQFLTLCCLLMSFSNIMKRSLSCDENWSDQVQDRILLITL